MHSTYLNTDHIGRHHSECFLPPDLRVILTNTTTGQTVLIIAKDGTICHFPGIESCPALRAEMNVDRIRPVVSYSAAFRKVENGRHLMIWTVRPDGRFWMDSWGFGAEDEDSVELYAYIDEKGQFISPFRLYSIGDQRYFTPSGEEESWKETCRFLPQTLSRKR